MRALAPAWICLAACLHPAQPPASAPEPAAAPPAPVPGLQDLAWQLRAAPEAPWAAAPESLHPFAVGKWECALGEVLYDDAREASKLTLTRTRKLACTHISGATVQTSLRCTLDTPALAASGPLPELELGLDAAPALTLACTRHDVPWLDPVARDGQPLGVLCATPRGLADCPRH